MRVSSIFICLTLVVSSATYADSEVPNTGVSGVYEAVVGTDDLQKVMTHFEQFGFREIQRARLSAQKSSKIYGVNSAVEVVRMQNGDIDSHGLLRIMHWESLISNGVGLAPPETVGVRMAVMRTKDIVRLSDVFKDAREISGEAYTLKGPVYDDLYKLNDNPQYNVINRRSGVRELAVYGASFNHIFFQRYGYTINGYGTIHEQSPLQSSEFTHHDFFIKGDIDKVTEWYTSVLGFIPEQDQAVLDGEWQNGPRVIFDMNSGGTHWYRGYVSPNNICGKLKFFTSPDPNWVRDRSDRQALGHGGITMHTVWTPKIEKVHALARVQNILASSIQANEFGEQSFLAHGPDGSTWQIIQRSRSNNKPVTKVNFLTTKD